MALKEADGARRHCPPLKSGLEARPARVAAPRCAISTRALGWRRSQQTHVRPRHGLVDAGRRTSAVWV